MQTQFTGLLNRRDLTPALTLAFLQQSILRIQRTLRIPAMEKSITATIGNLYSNGITVPGDLLQMIAMTDETDPANLVELQRVALPEVLRRLNVSTNVSGSPARVYARRGSKFVIGPLPSFGTVLRMDYYATLGTLAANTDTNVLGDVAPDLIIYGALSYGAAYFLDKRLAAFEQRFQQIHDDLQGQANNDELTGNACVSPAYHFSDN